MVMELQTKIIKLAQQRPDMRPYLLSILKKAKAQIKGTLQREITQQGDGVLPVGSEATITWEQNKYDVAQVYFGETHIKINTVDLYKYFGPPFTKAPDMKMSDLKGLSHKSVLGYSVGARDVDHFGSPSWLLVFGL